MDATTVTLTVGLTTAATTSLGWIVLHFFTRSREIQSAELIARREAEGREQGQAQADRTRRLELRLKYYEQQIQEFYAPLYSNIQLIWNVWSIGERFKGAITEDPSDIRRDEVHKKIRRTLDIKYFLPLHDEIRLILKTKLFLIEGIDMPESYIAYLRHSVTEDIRNRLEEEDGIDTSSVRAIEFPTEFPDDVKAGLDKAMRSYDDIIQELARSASAHANLAAHDM
jgi:hypothetical protein